MNSRSAKLRTAIALIGLGNGEAVWHLLRHGADPRVRSFIINWLKPLKVDGGPVALEFNRINAGGAARLGTSQPAAREGGKCVPLRPSPTRRMRSFSIPRLQPEGP